MVVNISSQIPIIVYFKLVKFVPFDVTDEMYDMLFDFNAVWFVDKYFLVFR